MRDLVIKINSLEEFNTIEIFLFDKEDYLLLTLFRVVLIDIVLKANIEFLKLDRYWENIDKSIDR